MGGLAQYVENAQIISQSYYYSTPAQLSNQTVAGLTLK